MNRLRKILPPLSVAASLGVALAAVLVVGVDYNPGFATAETIECANITFGTSTSNISANITSGTSSDGFFDSTTNLGTINFSGTNCYTHKKSESGYAVRLGTSKNKYGEMNFTFSSAINIKRVSFYIWCQDSAAQVKASFTGSSVTETFSSLSSTALTASDLNELKLDYVVEDVGSVTGLTIESASQSNCRFYVSKINFALVA